MPHATPAARVIGRIQRLCCFGPGGLSFIPDVMRELDAHLPSSLGPTFLRMGPDFHTNGIYSEDANITEMWRFYVEAVEEYRLETDVSWTDSQLINRRDVPAVRDVLQDRVRVGRNEWLNSDYYQHVFRPVKMDQCLQVAVISRADPARPVMLACALFNRTANDPAYTNRERRLLEAAVPYIQHALTDRRPEGPYVDTDDHALVIIDADGSMQHASGHARSLMRMARYRASSNGLRDGLPDEVIRLCRRVAAWSEDRPLTAPPVLRCRNDWGEFIFRVTRLEQFAGLPTARLLGVAIERREPLRLKLLRRLGELPLSARETELCLALLDGHSRADIAERMGVSETTAITHTRNLYNKLDVHNRMGLVEKLQVI